MKDAGFNAEEMLVMVGAIAESVVILIRTEVDGDLATGWSKQTIISTLLLISFKKSEHLHPKTNSENNWKIKYYPEDGLLLADSAYFSKHFCQSKSFMI